MPHPSLFDQTKIVRDAFLNGTLNSYALKVLQQKKVSQCISKDMKLIHILCCEITKLGQSNLERFMDELPKFVEEISLIASDDESFHLKELIQVLEASRYAKHSQFIRLSLNNLFSLNLQDFSRVMQAVPHHVPKLDLSHNHFTSLSGTILDEENFNQLIKKFSQLPPDVIDIDLSWNRLGHVLGNITDEASQKMVMDKLYQLMGAIPGHVIKINFSGNLPPELENDDEFKRNLSLLRGEVTRYPDHQLILDRNPTPALSALQP